MGVCSKCGGLDNHCIGSLDCVNNVIENLRNMTERAERAEAKAKSHEEELNDLHRIRQDLSDKLLAVKKALGDFEPVELPMCPSMCRATPVVVRSGDSNKPFKVICHECGLQGPKAETIEKAVELWSLMRIGDLP